MSRMSRMKYTTQTKQTDLASLEVGNLTDESLSTGGWSEHAEVTYDCKITATAIPRFGRLGLNLGLKHNKNIGQKWCQIAF